MMWALVLVASLGCWLQKVLGTVVPQRLLAGPRTRAAVIGLPVALLGALVATGTLADGRVLVLDARFAGAVTAALLAVLRAPFLAVLVAAVLVTAVTRALIGG